MVLNATRIHLPSSLIDMVFEYFHCSPIGGYLETYKTLCKIKKFLFWLSLIHDISLRMKQCHTFAISKPAAYTKVEFLSSQTPVHSMEKIHYSCVMLLTFSCTRWLWVHAQSLSSAGEDEQFLVVPGHLLTMWSKSMEGFHVKGLVKLPQYQLSFSHSLSCLWIPLVLMPHLSRFGGGGL